MSQSQVAETQLPSLRIVRGGRGLWILLLAITIGAALTAPGRILFGSSEVRYSAGGTREEARTLGAALVEQGVIGHEDQDSAWSFGVRRAGRLVIDVEPPAGWQPDEPEYAAVLILGWISRAVFPGEPVDLWLRDKAHRQHVNVPWEWRPQHVAHADGRRIVYRQGAQESEARRVSHVLAQHPLFDPVELVEVFVRRSGATRVVGFHFDVSETSDRPALVRALAARAHTLAEVFSREAFAGEPVEIWCEYTDSFASWPRLIMSWEAHAR
jgi:hypothetical protein